MSFSQWQLSHTATERHRGFFLEELGRKIRDRSGEPLEAQFLFQRVSVLVQRFNAILFPQTFPGEDDTAIDVAIPIYSYVFNIFAYYRGYLKDLNNNTGRRPGNAVGMAGCDHSKIARVRAYNLYCMCLAVLPSLQFLTDP